MRVLFAFPSHAAWSWDPTSVRKLQFTAFTTLSAGEAGLRHTPLSSPGLSRADAQCLIPSWSFAFQDLLGQLGRGREAQRGR